MSRINDAHRAALNASEAALLPALPRIRGAGTAALHSALQAAAAMEEKKLSNAVNTSLPMEEADNRQETSNADAPYLPVYRTPESRAALHHILKR